MLNSEDGMVLVTGGTGFIGAWLVRLLIKRGARVRLICRSAAKAAGVLGPGLDFVEGDVLNAAALKRACEGVRVVYHLAGLYAFGARYRRELWAVNVVGTGNVLDACRAAGVEKVVHCSTAGILASSRDLASRVDFPARIPWGCHYKASKWQGERAALEAARRGLPVTIASPTAPIGPGDERPTPTGRMIQDLLRARFPVGSRTGLNIIAVEDVAEGLLAIGHRGLPGERYILGDKNLWLGEFLEMVASTAGPGVRAPRIALPWGFIALAGIFGEVLGGVASRIDDRLCWETAYFARQRQFFELESTYEALGWRPAKCLNASIRETVAWLRQGKALVGIDRHSGSDALLHR